MNPVITNLLKPLLPSALKELDKVDFYIAHKLSKVEMQEGEQYAAFVLLPNKAGEVYLVLCAFDADDRITRNVERQKLNDFLHSIMDEIL